MRTKAILTFLIILILPLTLAINNTNILFETADTKYINITIDNTQISSFSFNITGSLYNSSYPSNITLDVGNDSVTDWEYFSYHSNISAYAKTATAAWSTNPNSAKTDIMSNMTNSSSGTNLGYLQNNIFYKYANIQNGTLGIREFEGNSISEQIMTIVTNTSTIHAFLPEISGYFAFAGLYVAKGGSTYYCNSDHTFYDVYGCNLTIEEAMTPTHLARESNESNYTTTKPVTNSKMKDTINSQLSICGETPCNITIKITSATAGNITLSDFQTIGTDPPANITITENTTHYDVNISPYATLTNVKYFYGTMPNVYLIPVKAEDETNNLSDNQTTRLNMLENTLKEGWDNLTNFSHPLNFTFYTTPIAINYSTSENDFSNFKDKAYQMFENDTQSPAIVIILDVYDYFPNQSAFNTRTTLDEHGRIGLVYINGFTNQSNKTILYNYDNEILRNIILHEITHSFIFYPSSGNSFHSDHPSSFTNLTEFDTYNTSESPTTNEGYYEIYSILNQLRPYIANEDIFGNTPTLGILDKMLLGILSPHSEGNYTFYSGNITNIRNRYNTTTMTTNTTQNASELYSLANTDPTYWDITNSSATNMGTSQSFSISKSNQNNRSLWIFASDAGHQGHFEVFNLNSNSIQTTLAISQSTTTTLNSPANNYSTSNQTINFNCSATNLDELSNITLYGNWSGWHANETANISGTSNSTTFTKNLPSGNYKWNCLAYGSNGNYDWANSNYTLTTDSTSPTITITSPTNTTYNTTSIKLNFSANEPVSNWWYSNDSGITNYSFTLNQTFIWQQGINTIHIWANDSSNNIGTSNVTFFINNSTSPIVSLNSPTNANSGTNQDITFNCSATNNISLQNATLYGDWSGWHANETANISGTSNSTVFTKNLPAGNYLWNCLFIDTENNYGWATSNYSLTITAPTSCGDTVCNGEETCSTCPTDCGTCSSSGGSGSSGDDDSTEDDSDSSTDDTTNNKKSKPINIILDETENVYTRLEEDSDLIFNIGNKEYTLTLDNVDEDTVGLKLMPGSITFDLEKEKENKINISQNESLYVRLNDITNGNVELALMKIIKQNTLNNNSENISLAGSKNNKSKNLTWIVIACCLIIIATSTFFYKKYKLNPKKTPLPRIEPNNENYSFNN